MKKTKSKILLSIITLFVVICSCLIVHVSSAYFGYKKALISNGVLPILKIEYSINTNDKNSLRNISFSGQAEENISVSFSTFGNNIAGSVRVEVGISWSNSLDSTPTIGDNPTEACYLEFDKEVWQKQGNYYYLIDPMEKDSEIEFFSKICFAENIPSNYRGQTVSIYLIPAIYQTTSLPQDW